MRIKRLAVLLLLVSMLAGCAGAEEGQVDVGQNRTEELTPTSKAEQGSQKEPEATNELEVTNTPIPEIEPILHEKMPEWDAFYAEYDNYYNAIQIEDMFFYTGMLGSEVVEAVANSADTALISIDGNKLIEADEEEYVWSGETQKITYYRGEEPWFDVYVRNYSGSLLPYNECLVSLVMPKEAAKEYCRFIDGTYTFDLMKELKYTEFDSFADKLGRLGYSASQEGNAWIITNDFEHSMASVMKNSEVKSIYWTWQPAQIELNINLDTGFVEDVALSTSGSSDYGVYGRQIPEDFDWSNENFINSLLSYFMGKEHYKLDELEKIELISIFQGENAGHFAVVFRGIRKSDGKVTYIACTDRDRGINAENQIAELTDSIEVPFYVINRIEKNTYVEVLDELKSYVFYKDAKLLYEYQEGLIAEYKQMESFADITVEQLNVYIEQAFKKVEGKFISEIKAMNPVYISYGNVAEGEHMKNNALWMVVAVDYYSSRYGDVTEYVYVHFYNLKLNVEANTALIDKDVTVYTGERFTDLYDLMVAHSIDGTPEENRWVTELLPANLARQLVDKYGYSIYKLSVQE